MKHLVTAVVILTTMVVYLSVALIDERHDARLTRGEVFAEWVQMSDAREPYDDEN